MTNAIALRASLNANIAERSRYEAEKNSAETITAQLCKHFNADPKTLETRYSDAYFDALVNAGLPSFDFINNHVKESQRFNIKALEKVSAKLRSIVDGKVTRVDTTAQKYCVACVATVLQNAGKDFVFNRKQAKAMLSRALRFEAFRAKACSVTFNVSESTADTQVSSSFRTLEALGILKFDDSERARSVVSDVNVNHPFVQLVQKNMLSE